MQKELEQLKAELARLREESTSLASLEAALEKEASARKAAEEELARQKAAISEADASSSRRKTGNNAAKEERRLALLEAELEAARKAKEELEEEVARITEEKEQLENQYDDALNNTLISFKSPARPVPNGRKSVGRLSLSGYADEFASLGVSNAELEALNKRTAELEHIVERQAEEIERLIKKGSVDDSYDMEGLDQRYAQLQEQLDGERQQATKYREEASRLSGLVESLNSERGVLLTRVRKYQEDELAYEATIAELESLQAECLAMRSEMEGYKKRVFNGDQTIEQLTRHVETSKNHIFALEDRLKVAERDLEASKYDNNALEQVLTRKNTVLNTELNTARSEIRKLRDEGGEAKTLNHKLKQENIDLSTNLQRWQAKASEFETKHHDSEAEAKRGRSELESIKRETSVALRNAEIREKEMSSTLTDNQTEMGNLSTELRNVKSERDHLLNQVRNVNDQIHEMKHSSAELLNETGKKHEAELVSLRQKSGELESLLQSARREKAHYESQFKALQKQGALEVQAAQMRVQELQQQLEVQKKLKYSSHQSSSSGVIVLSEQVEAGSLMGGKQVTVLGSPAVAAVVEKEKLQRHPTAPVAAAPANEKPLERHLTADVAETVASNPLAFWRAKINSKQQTAAMGKPPLGPTATVTPVVVSRPLITGTSPAAVPSPAVKVRRVASSTIVQEVRQELENEVQQQNDTSLQLSPIVAAKSGIDQEDQQEAREILLVENKENKNSSPSSSPLSQQQDDFSDAFSKVWRTALASRPSHWRDALKRLDAPEAFQFGQKQIACRMIGSDMLVIDGKSQMLVDRFLDQHGQELVNGPAPPVSLPAAPAPTEVKKAGLRFKNLKKQPLAQTNDFE